jgi:hypothetical protein
MRVDQQPPLLTPGREKVSFGFIALAQRSDRHVDSQLSLETDADVS